MTVDRRKFPRVKLHLPVRLYSSEGSLPTETETVDISRDGFYCVADRPFEPGARLRCVLVLPDAGLGSARHVRLEGTVEVVRISVGEGARAFGIGCCLRDYRLVESSEDERAPDHATRPHWD